MKKAIITVLLISPFALFAQTTLVGSEKVTYNQIELPDPALDEKITEFDHEYSTGVAYYNRAVLLLEKSLQGKKEVKVEEVITPVTEIFAMSEKHFLNAYALNSNDKATLETLSFVYFAMNNTDKYNSFKTKANKL